MDQIPGSKWMPSWLRELLSLTLTIAAVLMYAAVLGSGIVRTLLETNPTFNDAAVRAAGLLSGLIGAVISAGFARGKRVGASDLSVARNGTIRHPATRRRIATGWIQLQRPSRLRSKLGGLAGMIGFPVRPMTPLREIDSDDADTPAQPGTPTPTPAPAPTPTPAPGPSPTTTMWVALLYFAVYFIIGIAAFLLTILRPNVPELVANAGWVWVGTVVSVGYSFFALNQE